MPLPEARVVVLAGPRLMPITIATSAPTAATSAIVTLTPPMRVEGARSTTVISKVATSARPSPTRSPVDESAEWPSTAPTAEPALPASAAESPIPTAPPRRVPAIATTAASASVPSSSCHAGAPSQASRRLEASTSRRRLAAASSVNARSRATAWPPSSSRRRSEARAVAAAACSSLVGPSTWKSVELASICERVFSISVVSRETVHGWTLAGVRGSIHA